MFEGLKLFLLHTDVAVPVYALLHANRNTQGREHEWFFRRSIRYFCNDYYSAAKIIVVYHKIHALRVSLRQIFRVGFPFRVGFGDCIRA